MGDAGCYKRMSFSVVMDRLRAVRESFWTVQLVNWSLEVSLLIIQWWKQFVITNGRSQGTEADNLSSFANRESRKIEQMCSLWTWFFEWLHILHGAGLAMSRR